MRGERGDRMNILLVNYEYKPQCGGAGFGTYNLASQLVQLGHKVDILVGWDYKFGNPENIEGVCAEYIKVHKKNIHQSTALGLLEFVCKGMLRINKMTRKKRYDVVQFYFSVPTGLLKYGVHAKIPYVISLRGMDVPGFHKDKYSLLSIVTKPFNRNIVKNADAVTALSTEFGKMFNLFEPSVEPRIIPNGLEIQDFQVKEHYSDRVSKFVSVTRLTSYKKIDIMIKAFVELHKKYEYISLDIYGEGFQKEELDQMIDEYDAGDYVALKGYENTEVLKKKLCEYDAFELLTVSDSFGNVFIEAMACGLPIICARAGGPCDIVIDHVTGVFVEPNDLNDTIEKMEWCLEHPNEMKAYGNAGRIRVEEKYSIANVAKQHIDMFENILAKRV